MIYAINNIIPPKEWKHNPTLKDKNNQTVAMHLIDRKIFPPKEWCYNPDLDI